MARATRLLAVTTVIAAAAAIWLFMDNRDLRSQLAEHTTPATGSADKTGATAAVDPWTQTTRTAANRSSGPRPELPAQKEESRLDRRQRRQAELTALLGRLDGETEEQYRARIVPLIKAGLAIPRSRVEDMRKEAEAAAHVTADQSKKLDVAFDKAYDNLLDYTNKAVADGTLSPYERNVSGMLEYAGGLGTMLDEINGQIGQILSADQVKALGASGFEWGEYLGLEAPWENLSAPPPPKH
ncbi:MAG: hypothetical protein ABI678_12845 [Kofleriaceae bacterium]